MLYSENDFQNLIYLSREHTKNPKLDLDSMLRVYEGQTSFSIFY